MKLTKKIHFSENIPLSFIRKIIKSEIISIFFVNYSIHPSLEAFYNQVKLMMDQQINLVVSHSSMGQKGDLTNEKTSKIKHYAAADDLICIIFSCMFVGEYWR